MSKKNPTLRFDFMGKSKFFAGVSIFLTIASTIFVFIKRFNYGIDFAGGTEIQVKFDKPVTTAMVRSFTNKMNLGGARVQSFGDANEFLIRMDSIKGKNDKETNTLLNALIKKVTSGLTTDFKSENASIRRVDSVGPQVGSELKRNGILAAFYALLSILIYVGLRFDYTFAPAAVFCLFHDAIITLGIFSLFDREVNIQTLAAILTIIGYSLNDTIVNFDRIRENLGNLRDISFYNLINRSVNEVLSRTILTSLTTLLSVAAMYFFAGGVIQDFAFTLGLGVIIGTYSSIYVANPLVLVAERLQKNRKAHAAA